MPYPKNDIPWSLPSIVTGSANPAMGVLRVHNFILLTAWMQCKKPNFDVYTFPRSAHMSQKFTFKPYSYYHVYKFKHRPKSWELLRDRNNDKLGEDEEQPPKKPMETRKGRCGRSSSEWQLRLRVHGIVWLLDWVLQRRKLGIEQQKQELFNFCSYKKTNRYQKGSTSSRHQRSRDRVQEAMRPHRHRLHLARSL